MIDMVSFVFELFFMNSKYTRYLSRSEGR